MKKLLLSIFLSLLLLNGCGFLSRNKTPDPIAVEAIRIDPKLLQACDLIKNTPLLTPDDLALENIDLYLQYGICARKQDDSIKALKKIGGIK